MLAILLAFLSPTPASALTLAEVPAQFQCQRLPDSRISCSADSFQTGKFRCSLFGNFSVAEFGRLFSRSGQSAFSLSRPEGAFELTREEVRTGRPCLEEDEADSAPPACLKWDDAEYTYQTRLYRAELAPGAALYAECDDYALGRVRR